jgi:hypothetical protein
MKDKKVVPGYQGCSKHVVDLCIGGAIPPDSTSCAGAADEISFLQCVRDGRLCRAKICDKRVTNKDFCPKEP